MKKSWLWVGAALTLVVSSPAAADRHRAGDLAASFVKAWNAHDSVTMADLWTVDAKGVDALGRMATGRVEVARLFGDGDSILTLTTELSVHQSGPVSSVEFEGEVSGLRGTDGRPVPPLLRHFTAVMVWGPDLPGGHHPRGRYFIASMRAGNSAR